MTKKFNSVQELEVVCHKEYATLDNVRDEYLSEAGIAAKEAYRCCLWHFPFYDSLQDLNDSEDFRELVNISGKHPEYYKVLRKINRAIENSLK